MNRRQRFDCFQLNHDSTRNQEIHPVPALELHLFIHNGRRLLPLKRDRTQYKLSRQALLVCRFEQSRLEQLVDFDSSANDVVAKLVVRHEALSGVESNTEITKKARRPQRTPK